MKTPGGLPRCTVVKRVQSPLQVLFSVDRTDQLLVLVANCIHFISAEEVLSLRRNGTYTSNKLNTPHVDEFLMQNRRESCLCRSALVV